MVLLLFVCFSSTEAMILQAVMPSLTRLIEEETEQSVNPAKEEFVPYDLDPLHSTNAPEGVFTVLIART